ncbi:MAG: class I SAM-dependent methyltransferase [Calditrichaeota bacterium]|nr:class I SAM-dependent methyltransferase [Calditrichota bacterium]
MAIPILKMWKRYFEEDPDEGLGSSYERVVLNLKLESFVRRFQVSSVLEAPSFGFTGTSGINSMELARKGCRVTLVDHDRERLQKIQRVWQQVQLPLQAVYVRQYAVLPFADQSFDFSWNFAAIWFVDDLTSFLSELTRVTRKAIAIFVPNRLGMGFVVQKLFGKEDLKAHFHEDHIVPKNIIKTLDTFGWKFIETEFIDCPPWPDIGMPKEKFLQRLKLGRLVKQRNHHPRQPLTILNYYRGEDPDFPQSMMRYYWFEKYSPWLVKRFWAHHRYFLFIKE